MFSNNSDIIGKGYWIIQAREMTTKLLNYKTNTH